MKIAILANVIWVLFAMFTRFVLPKLLGYIAHLIAGAWFIFVPIVNHIRMLFAIRHHNRQLGDAVAADQMSAVLRREKKVAIDMCIVSIILWASLMPALSMKIFELHYPRVHAIALPWSLTGAFMTSCVNPVFYLKRNQNLRNAVKSMMNI